MDNMSQGRISIDITDYTESKENHSLTLSKDIYFDKNDDPISFDDYVEFCRSFAVAFGWSESLVKEIFG